MRWKALTVKILAYGTLALVFVAVFFLLGYRARHPIPEYADTYRNKQQPEWIVSVNPNNATPNNREGNNDQSYASKVFDPITLLTFLLVIGVGITAYIYWCQLQEMQKTVAAVAGQGQTLKLQYAAMEWQAGIMEIQTSLVGKQVEKMQTSLEESREALRVSQRAYVGLNKHPHLVPITTERIPCVVIHLTNSGRTPARDVEFRYRFSSQSGSEGPYINRKKIPIISAGMTKEIDCNWKGQLFEHYYWQQIDEGVCNIEFRGKLSYKDEWGKLHEIAPFKYFSVNDHELKEDYEGDEDYTLPDFVVEVDGDEEVTSEDYPEEDWFDPPSEWDF